MLRGPGPSTPPRPHPASSPGALQPGPAASPRCPGCCSEPRPAAPRGCTGMGAAGWVPPCSNLWEAEERVSESPWLGGETVWHPAPSSCMSHRDQSKMGSKGQGDLGGGQKGVAEREGGMGNRAGDREVAPGWEVQPQWRQRGHRGTGCSARSEGHAVPSLVTHKTNPPMSPGERLLLQTAPLNPPRWLAGGHQLWPARRTSLPGPLGRFARHQGIFGAFAQGFLQAGAADEHWGQEVTLWAWSPSLQPLHQPVFPLGVASWGEFGISLPLESVLCQGGALLLSPSPAAPGKTHRCAPRSGSGAGGKSRSPRPWEQAG